MKIRLFILLLSCLLFFLGCHKKKLPRPQLPPETQTGAGTFGCKINGQIVTANYADNFGAYAVYQYLSFSYPYESGYFLNIVGQNKREWYISIHLDSLKAKIDTSYMLMSRKHGNASGIYIGQVTHEYYTNDSIKGELTITKLDSINQIISGTFWFDAIDTVTGEKVQVRDGRFDLLYTK